MLVNKNLLTLSTIILLTLSLFATVTTAFAPQLAPHMAAPGRAPKGQAYSLNWAGYAVTASANSVTFAAGSWKIPSVDCSATKKAYSSFWVGIDGYSSSTVEQTGTDSDCRTGVASYYAWYEFYPNPPVNVPLTIKPGDVISAQVNYVGNGVFTVSITDVNTRKSSGGSATVSSAQRSSAECIAEAPSIGGSITRLAKFGTVYYGYDNTGVASTCYATIGGVSGSFGSFGSATVEIIMVTMSLVVKAQPSALSGDGLSFSVTWAHV